MPNDFLSSLASKALQNAEVDSAAGGLIPRLASRFETPARQVLPGVDQALGTEEFIEVETRQKPGVRKSSPAPGLNQPEIEDIHSLQSEQGPARVMRQPEHGSEEANGFLQAVPGAAQIQHPEPILGVFPSEVPPVRVGPASIVRAELSDLPGKLSANPAKNESTVRPETASRSRTVSMEPEPHQMRASAREIVPPGPVIEPVMPAAVAPVAQPANERKVIPERIEITRVEPQLRTSGNSPQIVPAVTLPELKPQRAAPEVQEQSPTIQVTIGRVEVKAATSGPAPKRRSSASATMSLEEYLRRRQGGER